jgi:hypothetical protein
MRDAAGGHLIRVVLRAVPLLVLVVAVAALLRRLGRQESRPGGGHGLRAPTSTISGGWLLPFR